MSAACDLSAINLSRFCATKDTRRHLHRPFSRAGYTWATNGRIMVRVPLRSDVPEVADAPAAERVWTDAPSPYFVPIKPFNIATPPRVECSACDGRGTVHDCPSCTCDCANCDGSGYEDSEYFVSIGKAVMNAKYAAAMLSLPGLEIVVPAPDDDRLHFRFTGGQGILMLMRRGGGPYKPIVADMLKDGVRNV